MVQAAVSIPAASRFSPPLALAEMIAFGLGVVQLVALPVAVTHARPPHRRPMLLLFRGALVVAGVFTLWPGRIMHDVEFGTRTIHGACR